MVSQGDIVIVDFDPSLGSEQKGKRPGLVISNNVYHKNTNGFAIVVPITSAKTINYPLHIKLDDRTKTYGEIMCEQLKTMDTKVGNLKVVEKLPDDILENVLKIVKLLF
jgi:mRNA interferase MazF